MCFQVRGEPPTAVELARALSRQDRTHCLACPVSKGQDLADQAMLVLGDPRIRMRVSSCPKGMPMCSMLTTQ
jgi:hypothetical protein